MVIFIIFPTEILFITVNTYLLYNKNIKFIVTTNSDQQFLWKFAYIYIIDLPTNFFFHFYN